MQCSFSIINWFAWAPMLDNQSDWLQWMEKPYPIATEDSPNLEFVPALQRRRLSRLSKMALYVAHHCLETRPNNSQSPSYNVFASRHGEITTSVDILEAIAQDEMVSPTAFSHSVHNTAAGLYSIFKRDVTPSTALAAAEATLEHAMIEAYSTLKLSANATDTVLVVISDEPLPKQYNSTCPPDIPYALALLVSLPSQDSLCNLTLSLSETKSDSSTENSIQSFLAWFLNPNNPSVIHNSTFVWQWHNAHRDAHDAH